MTTSLLMGEQRAVLAPISWGTYLSIVSESQGHSRITYDQGILEIMSPMLSHEFAKSLLGRLIERFTEFRNIDIRSSASTTFQRDDLEKGFEPDESYYIKNAESILGKSQVDLTIDPPPDLVVEIDLTRSSINKLSLFAAVGVPEVWRYDGVRLWIGCLNGGRYLQQSSSQMLSGFPLKLTEELLAECIDSSETVLVRKFVAHLHSIDR